MPQQNINAPELICYALQIKNQNHSFPFISIYLENKFYPLARPTTSFLCSHSCPGAYRPRSSTELLSPFVKNLMAPSFLKAQKIQNAGLQNYVCCLIKITTYSASFQLGQVFQYMLVIGGLLPNIRFLAAVC